MFSQQRHGISSPRYVPNRNGGDGDGGVTGTGDYGGWAYGVPVRTGVRDIKKTGAPVNPAALESSHLPLSVGRKLQKKQK